MSPRKKRNQEENPYNKILSVSAELMSQKGYNSVSFREIGEKVGLHKSSLFNYFKNKEDLLFHILETSFIEFENSIEGIIDENELKADEKLKKAIDKHLKLNEEKRARSIVFLNDLQNLSKRHQKMFLSRIKKYEADFEKIIVEMKGDGYFKGLDAKIVTYGIFGMLNWKLRWYAGDGRLKGKDISNIFYQMIIQGKIP